MRTEKNEVMERNETVQMMRNGTGTGDERKHGGL